MKEALFLGKTIFLSIISSLVNALTTPRIEHYIVKSFGIGNVGMFYYEVNNIRYYRLYLYLRLYVNIGHVYT